MSQGWGRRHYFLLALAVFLLDQATKLLIRHTMPLYEGRVIIPGFLNLAHVQNRGAAFGLMSDFTSDFKLLSLIVFSLLALVIIFLLLWRGVSSRRNAVGLAMIFGGAVGNLVDRLRHASVLDFLDFYVGSYHWPAFNVADSAIVIGATLLLFDVLFAATRQPQDSARCRGRDE